MQLPYPATFSRYFCCPAPVTLFVTHQTPNLSLTKTNMPNINSSSLALRRKRLGYEQKQIAMLLGHKNTYQISRYETGQRIPGLKTVLKLSILYGLPVRVLLDRYFHHCLKELEHTLKHSGLADKIDLENAPKADYCTYLALMSLPRISDRGADQIRRHIKVLVEERTKKILGK